ncbi:RNA-directed DNA polymerase, eukaryota, partial [Tanacetum coccineum]
CFIKAIHGNQGAFDSCKIKTRRSPWLDIIQDLYSLKNKGDDVFKSIFPRLYVLEKCKSITVADKLRQPSLVQFFRRLPRGGVEDVQLDMLRSRLSDVILPNMIEVSTRWVKVIHIKVNIHAWRVCLDKIPTRLSLSIRGIEIPSILCPICNSYVESTPHIFFSCPVTRHLRRKILRWWEIDDSLINGYSDWLNWLVNIRLPKHLKIFLEAKIPCRGLLFDEVMCYLCLYVFICVYVGYVRFGNQSIERDRLIGIGFVLDFVELISFTFGDKEMIS